MAQDENFDDLPYMANPADPDSARIDGSQAVRLIHKYVQKVPVDRFTRLTPVWRSAYKVGSETNQACVYFLPNPYFSPVVVLAFIFLLKTLSFLH